MPLDLPRALIRNDSFDPVVVEVCPEVSEADLEILLALDRATFADTVIDRCVPLGEARWAVGQRQGDDTVWRIVEADLVERLGGHPAWLWSAEAWFDPSRGRDPRARPPAALPLRHLVRMMAPVGGRNRRTIKTLAAAVSAVRDRRPVAVVVEPDMLASASSPARWMVLGLLSILPPGRRGALRLSVGDPTPPADAYDLVVTGRPPLGYTVIDAAEPPDEGDDLVAYYVRNRLYDDDPEALEAAAYGDEERWGDGIAALIRDGLPGVSEVTPEMIEHDPERAVRSLAARLRAGAPLDPPLIEQLVEISVKTRDPRPWRALARRTALQRADAVDALLARAPDLRPGAELVHELMSLYPRGAPLERWLPTLVEWIGDGVATEAALDAVQATLLEWPPSATAKTRAGVWIDAVRRLCAAQREDLAMRALAYPIADRIARDGGGTALIEGWLAVPAPSRSPAAMAALIEMLHGASADEPACGADQAVAELFVRLSATPTGDGPYQGVARAVAKEIDALVRTWARLAGAGLDDPVARAVAPTDHAEAFRQAAAEGGAVGRRVAGRRAGAPRAGQAPKPPGHRVDPAPARAAVLELVEPGVTAEHAADRAARALVDAEFPDAALAGAAESLAGDPAGSPIWALLAVTAADPDTYDDATIDATVVAFCSRELDERVFEVSMVAMERLGRGAGWEPLDHARWVVRLALAPSGEANSPLIVSLLDGIRARPDAVPFMTGVLSPMLELPPDHPGLGMLIDGLEPAGWQGHLLHDVIEAVGRMNIPLSVRRTLVALAESA
jgi:hypothetical protein